MTTLRQSAGAATDVVRGPGIAPHVDCRESVAPSSFVIDDELWAEVQPLIPPRERRYRYPGRKPIPDRVALNGILHVLHTGIAWDALPQEYGYGSGITCWRRLRHWQSTGVWETLHQALFAKLPPAGAIDWSRAPVDDANTRIADPARRKANLAVRALGRSGMRL